MSVFLHPKKVNNTAAHANLVFFPGPNSWSEAAEKCKEKGGLLARSRSEWENIGVYSKCRVERCWLGLTDAGQEGWWEWRGYVENKLGDYAPWKGGIAGGGAHLENCVAMFGSGYPESYYRTQWDDEACSSRFAFVCDLQVPPAEKEALTQQAIREGAAPMPGSTAPSGFNRTGAA